MLKKNFLAQVAACAAALGMIAPTGFVQAAQAPVHSARQVSHDVVLSQGTLTGQYLSGEGQAIEGAVVSVRQAGHEITSTTTDAKGVFQVNGLKNGSYELVTAEGVQQVRAWESTIAPPSAQKYATLVNDGAVRGQLGCLDALHATLLGLSLTGVILGVIALSDDDETRIIVSP